MKIQTRLLSGYAAISVLIVGWGALVLSTIQRTSPIVDELDRQVEALGQAVSLSGLSGGIAQLRASLSHSTNQFVHTLDPTHQREYDRASRQLVEVFDEAIKKTETEDDATIFRNLRQTSQKLEITEREMIALAKANSVEEARSLSQSDPYVELNAAISKFIVIFANRKQVNSQDEFSRLIDISTTIQKNRESLGVLANVTLVSVLLILVSSILVGILIARTIARPLTILREGAVRIGEGSLDHRIDMKRNDEIGVLSNAFDDMAERLRMSRDAMEATNRKLAEYQEEVVTTAQAHTAEVKAANKRLEQEIEDRIEAETRSRRHQDALAHVSRIHTVGAMTTSIAHELNQPLAAIGNYTYGCIKRVRKGFPEAAELLPILEKIVGQSERAGAIIKRVRNFVTKKEHIRSMTDINSLTQDAIGFVQYEAGYQGFAIELELGEDLPTALVDPIQIEQVLVNLVRNALDSMVVETGSQAGIHIRTFKVNDQRIEIAVSDTGVGLSADVQEKLFMPFFTTKDVGLGMGLAISRTIIEDHGGRIWATPNPDRGTTFHFFLPVQVQGNEEPERCRPITTLSA